MSDSSKTASGPAGVSKWVCPECGSPDVQISLPAWHTETKTGELIYMETDAEATIMYWHCGACDESGGGEPKRNE